MTQILLDDSDNGDPRLPPFLVWSVAALSAAPAVLHWCGADFSAMTPDISGFDLAKTPPEAIQRWCYPILRGAFVHTILEWTAFSIALVTAVFSFVHYQVKWDSTTPIIGAALFFPGMIDAFNTLAADGLISTEADLRHFIPFTWAISRTFNAGIMIVGALILLRRGATADTEGRRRGVWILLMLGVLYGLLAYLLVHACARVPKLPDTFFPRSIVPRPWDALPLAMFLVAGVVLPRFYRRLPSLFSHALTISVIPHLAAQLHATFGSKELYDNHFNSACFLKALAYLVPLTGLILDYIRVTKAETALRATEVELRVARDVQRDLLPRVPPIVPGYDIAGISYPTVAVGGDYFDYLAMPGGKLGIVVADVSGHDIGASIFMAQTRAYLRGLAHSQDHLDTLCADLNRCLVNDSQDRRFVTLFLVRLDPKRGVFDYATAGHTGHFISSAGEVRVLEAEGIPLAVLEDATWRAGPELPLSPGDLILAMTDGIIEAENPAGAQFGPVRAIEVVQAHRQRAAREIVEALHQAVRDHCGSAPLSDDLTIVVVKRNANPLAPA